MLHRSAVCGSNYSRLLGFIEFREWSCGLDLAGRKRPVNASSLNARLCLMS